MTEALSEIVEQKILPAHVEAMSDEAGVEIARKVPQSSRLFVPYSDGEEVEL